jgi:UDP:flavonoid glycosyltransferase YjiC (YdhE family)
MTIGSHRNPETFGRPPANVVIERFVPQMAILPQAAAVVSHGGSGTVLAALSVGVPQLCLPYFADQPLPARALAGAGAGLALDLQSLNSSMLAAALWRLVSERSFKENAGRIACEISAMPDPETVASCLVELG